MLDITIQLDISARLTPQIKTIICYHMKNVLLKNIYIYIYKNIERLNQNSHVNKNDT